ncbi:MAG: hypothetical protein IJ124_14585 [Clostridia bacterium]|nr:hypothetical protein [Clostridia bacterium]
MINIIMLALFVEAIVSAIKPLWKDGGKGLSVTEIVSIVVGIVMAVALRIDLFRVLVESEVIWDAPPWVDYVFYVMTGVAIGRGPSFIYDLWQEIKKWSEMKVAEALPLAELKTAEGIVEVDLNIDHWSVAQLRRFCEDNDIPCTGCVTKDDYMDAIVRGASDKPPDAD